VQVISGSSSAASFNGPLLVRAAEGTERWLGVAATAEVTAIADAVLAWAFEAVGSEVDPDTIAMRLGWRVQERELSAAAGGLQAVLAPMLRGGFTIVVDPRPTPAEVKSRRTPRAVRSIRIAHELGHALFYERGRPPTRAHAPLPDEEHFCDVFAAALLSL
jgi:hypothetical protein